MIGMDGFVGEQEVVYIADEYIRPRPDSVKERAFSSISHVSPDVMSTVPLHPARQNIPAANTFAATMTETTTNLHSSPSIPLILRQSSTKLRTHDNIHRSLLHQ